MNTLAILTWPWPGIFSSGSPSATEEQMPEPTLTESHTDQVERRLSAILARYSVRDPGVISFLRTHEPLLDIVLEASERLRRLFGHATPLELHLFRDPETGNRELFALIHVPPDMPVEEILATLDAFDRSWFVTVQDRVGNLFNVDVVFDEV